MTPRIAGRLDGRGLRVAVLVARWNPDVTDRLLAGALEVLAASGVADKDVTVVEVPGAYELPQAAAALAAVRGKRRPEAIVALGCLIRGETIHDRVLADACAKGLLDVSVAAGIPVTFGVITAETKAQADERSDLRPVAGQRGSKKGGHKGREAAEAALRPASAMRGLRSPRGTKGPA